MTEMQAWIWLAAFIALEVSREVLRVLRERADRQERERMARLLAAKNVTDAAVAEKILARPLSEAEEPSGPGLYDDMYGTNQPKKKR